MAYHNTEAGKQIEPDEVHKMMQKGLTLVINHVNHRHPVVAKLCSHLAAIFGVHVNAHVYLTPPSQEVSVCIPHQTARHPLGSREC